MTTSEEEVQEIVPALDWAAAHTNAVLSEPEEVAAGVYIVDRHTDRAVEALDLRKFLPKPERHRGSTVLHTPASFVDWTQRHGNIEKELDLFANVDGFVLTSILNPSRPYTSEEPVQGPDHEDYRGVLTLRPSPQWKRWTTVHERALKQVQFAEFVQLCAADFVDPAALDMLEIAETLQINSGAKVSNAVRLKDGQRRIVFEETVEARAGGELQVEIPEKITLRIPIFEGCDVEEIEVFFRYQQREGQVAILLIIVEKEERERQTFESEAQKIAEALETRVMFGGV